MYGLDSGNASMQVTVTEALQENAIMTCGAGEIMWPWVTMKKSHLDCGHVLLDSARLSLSSTVLVRRPGRMFSTCKLSLRRLLLRGAMSVWVVSERSYKGFSIFVERE